MLFIDFILEKLNLDFLINLLILENLVFLIINFLVNSLLNGIECLLFKDLLFLVNWFSLCCNLLNLFNLNFIIFYFVFKFILLRGEL